MVSQIIVAKFEHCSFVYTLQQQNQPVSFYSFVSRASVCAKTKHTNELKALKKHAQKNDLQLAEEQSPYGGTMPKFDNLKYIETSEIFDIEKNEDVLKEIFLKKSSFADKKYVICNPDDAIKKLASKL